MIVARTESLYTGLCSTIKTTAEAFDPIPSLWHYKAKYIDKWGLKPIKLPYLDSSWQKTPSNCSGSNRLMTLRPGYYTKYQTSRREHLMFQRNSKVAGSLSMPRMFMNVFANSGRRIVYPRLELVDRGECPALLNLTDLTHDPDLQHYIRAQVHQVKSDFQDDSIFPGSEYQGCSCSPAGTSHWRLAKKIKTNGTGWQDDLAQSLLPYVVSHLSASIVANVHEALTVDQPLEWRKFAPCDVRQNRNNPSFVLEAAGRAIQARLMLHEDSLQRRAVVGGFLNAIKTHWLGCEWFRGGHKGGFPEHEYMRHELFQEALNTYEGQPMQETFQSSVNILRWSLAALSCPLGGEHPKFHYFQCGPASEPLEDKKDSESSKSVCKGS